jgi:hypothetical protein
VPKDGASASGSGGNQDQTGQRSEASANNNKEKPNAEIGPGEMVAEPNRVPEEMAKTKTKVETSLQQPPNQTICFLWVQGRGRL